MGNEQGTETPREIKPSDVTKPLGDTPWQNCERDTVATNILKLSHFRNGNEWKPFTWKDYVKFCSHKPSWEEKAILDEFAETGYLAKDADGTYSFTLKIIEEVYARYCG